MQNLPLDFQKPKLSSNELDSGSSNTLAGACLCPLLWESVGWVCTGRSATTSELLRRSILRGSTSSPKPPNVGPFNKNSQFRTGYTKFYQQAELQTDLDKGISHQDQEPGGHNPFDHISVRYARRRPIPPSA